MLGLMALLPFISPPFSFTRAFYMTGFDIIGDIHGHADELEILLERLGYVEVNGVRQHPKGRRVVFLGDFIDRGPAIRRVLERVKGMIDHGSALAVMGNHELNALHYQTWDEATGKWLRSHTEGHLKQFSATLEQLGDDLDGWLDWMRTLPVWLKVTDESGQTCRFIHASWNEATMEKLYTRPTEDGLPRFTGTIEAPRLTQTGLFDFGRRKDPVTKEVPYGYKCKERLLTGPEIKLPDDYSYIDKEGTRRTHIRIKWWVTPDENTTLADMLMASAKTRETLKTMGGETKFLEIPRKKPFVPFPVEGLTFFGHYWLDKTEIGPLTSQLACLDFSVARGGALVAYRYHTGDKELFADRFVAVDALPE